MRDANTLYDQLSSSRLGFGVALATIALRLGEPLGRRASRRIRPRDAVHGRVRALALLSLVATAGALRLRPGAGDVLRRAPAGAEPSRRAPLPHVRRARLRHAPETALRFGAIAPIA